jgi:hypothetical protein
LGLDSRVEGVDGIWPLDEADVVDFERIMDTLTFQGGIGARAAERLSWRSLLTKVIDKWGKRAIFKARISR